jgi:RNA polymerase sigma factor (sigma-70 family)
MSAWPGSIRVEQVTIRRPAEGQPAAEATRRGPPVLPDVIASPATEPAADAELLARFATAGDEYAFAVLVERYGPLVLGVCRRVLRDPHAAEDAFQATFMVLARKGGSIDRPEHLAGWLHGVAARVAQKSKVSAARRLDHERRAEPMPPPAAPDLDLAWQELRRVLDEELTRLPEPDRTLLVLCYLDGQTHEQAAARLDVPRGSVAWRLARAREALRRRLERRGVCLGVGPVALLSSAGRPELVPADLAGRAADAARYLLNGPTAGAATAAALADAVLRDLDRRRPYRTPPWWLLALALVPLLAIGAAAAGVARSAGSQPPDAPPPAAVRSVDPNSVGGGPADAAPCCNKACAK